MYCPVSLISKESICKENSNCALDPRNLLGPLVRNCSERLIWLWLVAIYIYACVYMPVYFIRYINPSLPAIKRFVKIHYAIERLEHKDEAGSPALPSRANVFMVSAHASALWLQSLLARRQASRPRRLPQRHFRFMSPPPFMLSTAAPIVAGQIKGGCQGEKDRYQLLAAERLLFTHRRPQPWVC